jgi:hypothetical protein
MRYGLVKDVSERHQRVLSVTFKDTRGLHVDSNKLAIYRPVASCGRLVSWLVGIHFTSS